jgi:NAD(P)-dependent dehydrogenase (short-subunit alcohol dehydrogenase family)
MIQSNGLGQAEPGPAAGGAGDRDSGRGAPRPRRETLDPPVKPGWNAADIPDLTGRTAAVTGANSGTGFQIACQLAAHGARVVLACRHPDRAAAAVREIGAAVPAASVEGQVLDLGSLRSVRRFAAEFSERHDGLDILVNNAGISGGPRRETADGFEAHLGVNYLGHFALTGLLLPALLARPGSRVVTMSSGLAARASIDFDDLGSRHGYRMTAAYGQSKLAGLVFAVELDRRARAAGAGLASLAAHPGAARTSLLTGKHTEWGRGRDGTETLVRLVQFLLGQSAAKAALPALYQATGPGARGGSYVGTRRHLRGYPAVSAFPAAALSQATATRLWQASQDLTGISYESLPPGSGAAG